MLPRKYCERAYPPTHKGPVCRSQNRTRLEGAASHRQRDGDRLVDVRHSHADVLRDEMRSIADGDLDDVHLVVIGVCSKSSGETKLNAPVVKLSENKESSAPPASEYVKAACS